VYYYSAISSSKSNYFITVHDIACTCYVLLCVHACSSVYLEEFSEQEQLQELLRAKAATAFSASFLIDPPVWRTDRQTDGQNCCISI